MIRILHIVDSIKRDSGISSFIMNSYVMIDKEKFQYDFLVGTKTENSYENEINKLGGNVYYIGDVFSIRSIIKANKKSEIFIKDNISNYDIFHLHTSAMSIFTLRYVKKYGGNCRIIHSHSSMTSKNKIKASIHRILNVFGLKYASDYFACSAEAADFLFGKNSKIRESVTIIKNAVNPEDYNFSEELRINARKSIGITNEVVLLHVSNFSPIKNISFLILLLDELIKKKIKCKLLLVGDGPEKKKIEIDVKKKGLESKCIFTGKKTNVKTYYNIGDIFLLPSIKEGLPVSVIEAQACGLYCVVSDPITRECDVGNVKFLPLEIEKWKEHIELFIHKSKEERLKKAKEFNKSVFSMKQEILRIEKIYSEKATK